MATKSKLEQAVEECSAGMNDAQREIVKSQLSEYRRNSARLERIDDELKAVNARATVTLEELRAKQAERSALSYEYHQLATANAEIADKLYKFMEERQ